LPFGESLIKRELKVNKKRLITNNLVTYIGIIILITQRPGLKIFFLFPPWPKRHEFQ
jgi:hypothetical protein